MSTPNAIALDEEEDTTCPLCMEEMDIIDKNFVPCPCGYRVIFFTSSLLLLFTFLFRFACGVGIISKKI
jgi:DNA-directed RNA polymerase subunit RPC12/RpoP